jgi:O-antigen ligase
MAEVVTTERARSLAGDKPVPWTNRRGRPRIGQGLELRKAPAMVALLFVMAYIGVAVIEPGLPGKFAFCDPVILVLCAYSIASMMYRGSEATSGIARLLPWVWLILLGSFLGLATVGIPNWAMSNLARTMFALLTFCAFWHLLIVTKLQRMAVIGTAIAVTITCAYLAVQSGQYRAPAFFQHPNYTGHFMTMAFMVLFVVSKRWYTKALCVLALVFALQQTSSFGAIAMLIAMIAVYAMRALTRNTAILAAGLAILAVAGLFMATPQAQDLVSNEDPADWTISESLSVDRFERSGDTRLILWSQALEAYAEQPLGIGPDGVRSRKVAIWRGHILEIHSDSLGYLVERGVVGLVGFIGLWVTIWRLARKGGLARVLIAGILVQGLFRETMHYRHMWLLLALAFAIDYARANAPPNDDEAEPAVEPPEDTELDPSGAYFPGAPRWPAPST